MNNDFRLKSVNYLLNGLTVGVVVGALVSAFRWIIEQQLSFVERLYILAHQHHLLLLFILGANIIIGLVVAVLIKENPNIKGSGIPQVKGQLLGKIDYPYWSALWRKFVSGVLSIGSGLFLGREGPSIQIGSTAAQGIAAFRNVDDELRRVIIAAGAAAGLSAAFNAPIASSMFVLEEIYHRFPLKVWPTVLGAAAVSNFVSTVAFGQQPALHIVYQDAFPLGQYWHLIILGCLLGLGGLVYQQSILYSGTLFKPFQKIPNYLWVLVPLVLILPIGYFMPITLGGGNQLILAISKNVPSISILALYIVVRLVFATLSYGSGAPGGFFLPILAMGALLGATYGQIMVQLGLLPAPLVINLIIFSMAAYFACITKSVFTAVLLITEMVGTVTELMPLAITALIAYAVVDLFNGQPIYDQLLNNIIKKRG
ncbi:ClC family H(+)/Cl(-) exchange transporter [Nicoliella lavandulae]|uniref:ClC family H(+)/Cl(-) exchange transporter n=1 Tax=Nicoliella lavandulae TaxID=3082954 RepID=A0ABU8SK69_9LACO